MKIDIAIPFNDLVPPEGMGMVQGQKPPYYSQLLYLIRSIKLNWDKSILDYSLYAHHSRNLDKEKQEELESLGCTVVSHENELQPYLCKENIFTYETAGDQTLILDTDMIVLQTPTLENEKDIYVKVTRSNTLKEKQWRIVLKMMGLKWDTGRASHFNLGCMLIKNDKKKKFYDLLMDSQNLKVLKVLESYNRHMGIQLYYSLLILKFNWGTLSKVVNYYSSHPEFTRMLIENKIDILHYLGKKGMNDEVRRLLSQLDVEK